MFNVYKANIVPISEWGLVDGERFGEWGMGIGGWWRVDGEWGSEV